MKIKKLVFREYFDNQSTLMLVYSRIAGMSSEVWRNRGTRCCVPRLYSDLSADERLQPRNVGILQNALQAEDGYGILTKRNRTPSGGIR
jgi:hypothetical protein